MGYDKRRHKAGQAFSRHQGPPVKKQKCKPREALVNYVWIHAKADRRRDSSAPLCTVPTAHMETAVENANRYPNADFSIWIDSKLTGPSTLFWLQGYIYVMAKHRNVRVRDLQSIAHYRDDAFFVPPAKVNSKQRAEPQSPYLRADYARILVIENCLNHAHHRFVFYSDFDCPDLRLNKTMACARVHGVVIHDIGDASLTSNGYIGVDRMHGRVGRLMGALRENTRAGVVARKLGYQALQAFVTGIHPDFARIRAKVMLPLLPHMYVKAAPSKLGAQLGLERGFGLPLP